MAELDREDQSKNIPTTPVHRSRLRRAISNFFRNHQHVRNAFIPRPGNDYRPHALRPHWIGFYAAIIIAVKIMALGFAGLYADQARLSDVTPAAIITLTNQARQQFKVPVLRTNALLSQAAQAKANDMVQAHYFAHISPSKVTPWYWFKKAGYSYSYAGENLAIDFIQSEDVIQAWLNSPSHRANLLSPKYKDVGVAVVTGNVNGVDSLLVVQMFGAPIPKPVVRPATKPAQTPAPTTAKATLAAKPVPATPKPVVLGEATPPTPPAMPTVETPADQTILRTNIPSIIGQAEPGSVVTLLTNGQSDGTAVVPDDGVYTIIPTTAIADGRLTLQVRDQARGLLSDPSAPITVSVDTTAPTINTDATYALSSLIDPSSFDVWTSTSTDAVHVDAAVGTVSHFLASTGQHQYYGRVAITPSAGAGTISVIATDAAGNATQALVVDPDHLSAGVAAPTSGVAVNALYAIFFSHAFLLTFIIAMLMLATLNVVVEIEHQHHPTILASLLVVYLAGALLFI